MKIGRELDALRLEAELDPACRSIVAYLRVRLDSTANTDLDQLAQIYVAECELAAQRALTLAERLAADRSSGNRVGGRQVQIVNRVGQDRGLVQSGV